MDAFVERVDERSVKWLLTQLSNEFVVQNTCDDDDDCKYTYVKQILQKFEKGGGVMKVTYKKSLFDTYKILRDYGQGVQCLPRAFRGLICKKMYDNDMKNAHIEIIRNICKKYNISCVNLTRYCNERNALIESGEVSKIGILKSMNKKQKLKATGFMELFDIEMKQLQQRFLAIEEFQNHKTMASTKNPKNIEGTFMSYVATSYEVIIKDLMIDYCRSKNIEVAVQMFDGFMTYSMYDGLLGEMEAMIQEKIGFDIKLSLKEHDDSLVVPDDFKVDDPAQLYAELKKKYEKDYGLAYIEKNVSYAYKVNGKYVFYNNTDIRRHFDNVLIEKATFFDYWVQDKERQCYSDIGVYPHDVVCPENILNMWDGYDIEKHVSEIVPIDIMLDHIKMLVHNDELIYNFILDWFANMFQFPSTQSIMIALTGKEGTGKSALVDLITNILGKDKSKEIIDIDNQLFGSFNGDMSMKVFYNINEISKKDVMQFDNKLKTRITSPTITINEKGVKKYEEQNLGHYLLTTNMDNVLNIKEGSRRYFVYETNDEKVGDAEYFTTLFSCVHNKKFQYSFYRYMMDRKVKKQFTIKDIPITETMKESFVLNRDVIEDYCEQVHWVGECSADDNYVEFKTYLQSNGYNKFEITKKSFEMKFNKYIEKYGITKRREDTKDFRGTKYSKTLMIKVE